MKTKTSQLPNKPSELIRVALKDLKKAERSPRYKINMDVWHMPNGKCSVCFAGGVMAFSCKASPEEECTYEDFSRSARRKFLFLNSARQGKMGSAFEDLGRSFFKGELFTRKIVSYMGKGKAKFKQQMSQLATDLAKAGY